MTSFAGDPHYDPTSTVTPAIVGVIENNGFFPPVDVADFIAVMRITPEFNKATILHELKMAMRTTNNALLAQACQWVEMGWYTLGDVPSDWLDSPGSDALLLYKDAVYSLAKCGLMQAYSRHFVTAAKLARKDAQENIREEAAERCPELMHRYRQNLNALQGHSGQLTAVLL